MSEYKATLSTIKANVPLVLNIGLTGPKYKRGKLLPSQRVVLYSEALKEIMMPGYLAEVVADFDTEPTLVVEGKFSELAANSTLIWEMLVGAEQDCVALSYQLPDRDERCNYLFGPRAEAWEPFDLNFFLFPSTNEDSYD